MAKLVPCLLLVACVGGALATADSAEEKLAVAKTAVEGKLQAGQMLSVQTLLDQNAEAFQLAERRGDGVGILTVAGRWWSKVAAFVKRLYLYVRHCGGRAILKNLYLGTGIKLKLPSIFQPAPAGLNVIVRCMPLQECAACDWEKINAASNAPDAADSSGGAAKDAAKIKAGAAEQSKGFAGAIAMGAKDEGATGMPAEEKPDSDPNAMVFAETKDAETEDKAEDEEDEDERDYTHEENVALFEKFVHQDRGFGHPELLAKAMREAYLRDAKAVPGMERNIAHFESLIEMAKDLSEQATGASKRHHRHQHHHQRHHQRHLAPAAGNDDGDHEDEEEVKKPPTCPERIKAMLPLTEADLPQLRPKTGDGKGAGLAPESEIKGFSVVRAFHYLVDKVAPSKNGKLAMLTAHKITAKMVTSGLLEGGVIGSYNPNYPRQGDLEARAMCGCMNTEAQCDGE